MASHSSKSAALKALIWSFIIASVLTYLIFIETKSIQTSIYLILVVLTALVLLVIVNQYLPKRVKDRVRKRSKFFIYLDLITHELIANRISLIISGLLLVLFLGMGQAEELLLHLADSKIQPPMFFAILMILALLSWYATRIMYMENAASINGVKAFFSVHHKSHLNKGPDVNHIRSVLPKLLGLIIILIPTFFILKLYLSNVEKDIGIGVIIGTGLMFWILILIVFAFVKVSVYKAVNGWLSSHKWTMPAFIALLALVSLIPAFLSEMDSPKRIPVLYFSGLIVAIIYFLITSLKVEKRYFFNQSNDTSRNRIKYLIFWGSIGTSLFFISFNFLPLYFNINGLTILLAGLTFYSFVAYIFIIIGGRIHVPVLTIIMVIGSIISFSLSPKGSLHDVRLTSGSSKFDANNRVGIDQYISGWFAKNKSAIDSCKSKKKFPILFISAEGGGSRAAFWTLLVHDALEKTIPNYYQHIFSMSGASGGNTGNSFYLAFQEIREQDADVGTMAKSVFENDFVSTDIGMLFGRDTWQSMTKLHVLADRSEILQQKWENKFDAAQNLGYSKKSNPLRQEFLSFWYDSTQTNMQKGLKYKHPLFLLNTTHIQSGDHATLSAVKLENFIPQNMDLIKAVYDSTDEHKSVPLSSGTLMNARFPFVCPTGKIPKVGNFVDAGYYDNFGASETRAAMLAVLKYLENDTTYSKDDFQFIHLAFRNGLPDKKVEEYVAVRPNLKGHINEKYKPYKSITEPIAPVIGLANAAFAHPNRELAEIESVADISLYFDLRRTEIKTESGDTILPIIPLSRHLSKYAIQSMQACIRSKNNVATIKKLKTYFSD